MFEFGITAENFNPMVLYVGRGKTEKNFQEKYHSHNHVEFLFLLSGECTYKIDGETYQIKKGNVIVCNPGVFHAKSTGVNEGVEEFYTGIDKICLKNYTPNHLIDKKTCPVLNLSKYRLNIEKCCNEIILEQENNSPGSDLILKSLIMQLVATVLKETYLVEHPDVRSSLKFESYENSHIVNKIMEYFNENYMEEISLNKISKNLYLSPVYISKVFKEETGDSPINYLIKKRLSKAEELLKEGNLSIKAIANSVGYVDAYHFSKLFKKYYGCSPISYRK